MNRRNFLKVGGLFPVALLVYLNLGKIAIRPVEVEADGNLYRGTFDGLILVSANSGKTWQLHTNFGPVFSILSLSVDFREQLLAQLEYEGHSFELSLAQNGTVWKTV